MRSLDRSTGRVATLIVLVVLLAAAVHGYVPAVVRSSRDRTSSLPAGLLLGAALVIVAVSLAVRLRERRAKPGKGQLIGLSEGAVGAGRGRPRWRVVLVALAVLIGWLVAVLVLARLTGHHLISQQGPGPATPTPVPGDTAGSPEPAPQPRGSPPHGTANVLGYLAASTAAMLLLIAAGTVATVRRRRRGTRPAAGPPARPPDEPAPGKEDVPAGRDSLVRAAAVGLAEIGDPARGPREAIIACYAAMERELAQLPEAAPQEFDTPTEVLARAVHHHALQADNAARLVGLFTEARFSVHVMNESHRQAAVAVLELVLRELPRGAR